LNNSFRRYAYLNSFPLTFDTRLKDQALKSLPASIIEQRLDELLDAVLSSRRTVVDPAIALAKFSREQQEFALSWLSVITKTNSELGYQFILHAPQALTQMDRTTVEKWIIHTMDIYDRLGLYPASQAFEEFEGFARDSALEAVSVTLDEKAAILDNYIRGLSGRTLRIEAGSEPFTDTETVWLPSLINRYTNKQNNFILYKAIAAHLWAQIHHGTFRRSAPDTKWLSEHLNSYPDPDRAKQIFHSLETHRLDTCIERELPGLAKEMRALVHLETENDLTPAWRQAICEVEKIDASVNDTLEQLVLLYEDQGVPTCRPWQGALYPERAEATTSTRIQRESRELQEWLSELAEKPKDDDQISPVTLLQIANSNDPTQHNEWRLEGAGEPIIMPDRITSLLRSALLDFDAIPPDYLVVGGGDGDPPSTLPGQKLPTSPQDDTPFQPGDWCYDEWDFRRRHYRKNWCVLREIDMRSSSEPLVEQTLEKYSGLVSELRRTFEALRGENRRLKRQPNGDDIDLEAVVEAQAAAHAGHEVSEQLFTQQRTLDRDTAVMFMVDVSGSTKGWINDAERESLVLLCEAVEILGDQYAIYGFSGMTRKRCELYRIKRFDDAYDRQVKARIAGIRPQDYTRMGVTIRHLTKLLLAVEARTRLLVTLSDGKPDDYDGYRGEYGIEDTRQALIEARRIGIHPFCITIDRAAREYLPRMYGDASYALVSEVNKLPGKVSEIYRRLTT
jgi:nitric oxide reductase NorD protein